MLWSLKVRESGKVQKKARVVERSLASQTIDFFFPS
jgi:hypothetical protein